MTDHSGDLARIETALALAGTVLSRFRSGHLLATAKTNSDPVTEADLAVDRALRKELVGPGEAWLSEETADDLSRLGASRVWVVDPLDGTREFVQGLPEWCVSVALVEEGQAVAGGILNPAAGFLALGAEGLGCHLNGGRAAMSGAKALQNAKVLASRTEVNRGQWDHWNGTALEVEPMGSIAYKLARVACGLADATWTLVPKHEWDVAAGVALIRAAGGWAVDLEGLSPRFNRPNPLMSGLIATGPGLAGRLNHQSLAAGTLTLVN
jgi:myo-inositol-1(or 4)-monophosphatase